MLRKTSWVGCATLHRLHVPILLGERSDPPTILAKLVEHLPWLSAVPAYLIGVGVRSQHALPFAPR